MVKEYLPSGVEYDGDRIEAIYHAEGRIVPMYNPVIPDLIDSFRYEYVIRDHLGNGRVYFSDRNEDSVIDVGGFESEVIQENHYYPFGLGHEGPFYPQQPVENLYQYNGKEWNEDLGLNWIHYGARFYDPAIGRWNTVDPLAEVYQPFSPYNYALNNPIRFIAPNGMNVDDVIENEIDYNEAREERVIEYNEDGMPIGVRFTYTYYIGSNWNGDWLAFLDRLSNSHTGASVGGFPRSAFRFQNITSNSQAAAIVDITVTLFEKKGEKPHRFRTMRLTIEVTLPIQISKALGGLYVSKRYAAEKSAWAADAAMRWLAQKMSLDKKFGDRAWLPGGEDFVAKQFAAEMQSYLNVSFEKDKVEYPAIPGARVQTTLSGKVSPSKVTAGDILLEYVRNILGY